MTDAPCLEPWICCEHFATHDRGIRGGIADMVVGAVLVINFRAAFGLISYNGVPTILAVGGGQ